MAHMRGPLDAKPDEVGWWLASDGMWYPPEQSPGWMPPVAQRPRLFDSADRPSAIALGLLAVASVVASWLVLGWDLSEVDAQNRRIDHPIAAWRFPVGVALLLGAIVLLTWIRPRAWKWIAATAALGVEFWYTWRGYAGRTEGANMTGVGSVFLFAPIVALTFSPAWVTARLAGGAPARR
jgi:hypothetical protein